MNRDVMVGFIFTIVTAFMVGCGSDGATPTMLEADFSISESSKGDNYRLFSNTSKGDYSLVEWDFANGESSKEMSSVEIYYPEKGEYPVKLTIWENGESGSITKDVTIDSDDSVVDFDIITDAADPYQISVKSSSSTEVNNLTWSVEGIGSITDVDNFSFYCGKSGIYTVTLQGNYNGVEVAKEREFTIANSDVDYWSKVSLSWEDEFDGDVVDSENWTHETGSNGWGNDEWQSYTPGDNSTVTNGNLYITAKKIGDGQKLGDYTSSRLISKGKQSFKYGRIEIRAKIPADKGNGIWPAIWMLGESISSEGWPGCGEVDIMEYVSYQPNISHSAIHTTSSSGNTVNTSGDISLPTIEEEFHSYGVLWDSEKIQFYIDDIENITYSYNPSVKNEDTWPFDSPQFLLLNIAVGGNWGGAEGVDDSIFPTAMIIDYVKVYQHNAHLE